MVADEPGGEWNGGEPTWDHVYTPQLVDHLIEWGFVAVLAAIVTAALWWMIATFRASRAMQQISHDQERTHDHWRQDQQRHDEMWQQSLELARESAKLQSENNALLREIHDLLRRREQPKD